MQWISLEFNIFSFIPLCCINQFNEIKLSQRIGVYFLCQRIFSLIFLRGLVNSWFFFNSYIKFRVIFIILGLLGKLGLFPFYFWIPKVVLGFGNVNNFFLFTFQKIGPLFLLESIINYSIIQNYFFVILVIFSFIISRVIGSFQRCFLGFISYSSIGHGGWIILSILCSLKLRTFYLFFYIIVLFFFFFFIEEEKKKIILEVIGFKINSLIKIIIICLIGIIMSGLPPFPIFFLKIWILYKISKLLSLLTLISLYLVSCLRIYFYRTIWILILLKLVNEDISNLKIKSVIKFFFIFFINIILFFILILFIF